MNVRKAFHSIFKIQNFSENNETITEVIAGSKQLTKYSGTSLKRASSKAETSMSRTVWFAPNDFLKKLPQRNLSEADISKKWSLHKADTFSSHAWTFYPKLTSIKWTLAGIYIYIYIPKHSLTTAVCSYRIDVIIFFIQSMTFSWPVKQYFLLG